MASYEQVLAYLKKYRGQYSLAALKSQLAKQNVPPELMERALREMESAAPPPPTPMPGQPPTQPPAPTGSKTAPLTPRTPLPPSQATTRPPAPAAGALPRGYVPPKAPPVPPPPRSFILVVDDDQLIREMLVAKLEAADYRVTCAEDAAQSVIQAEGMRIMILISDIEMPGFGSGVDALKKLRAAKAVPKKLPVVFVTGMPPSEAKKIVPTDDPYVRLMHKPVDWKLLSLYIRDLTGVDRPLA